MRRAAAFVWCLVGSAIFVSLGWGCGTKGTPGFVSAEDDAAVIDDAHVFGTSIDAGPGDACKGPRCSSDLHSLVDCDGRVLMTCPPDKGCDGSECVAACDSARANKSSIGCDFYSVDPDVIEVAQGSCFAAFVANTWSTPVTLGVERAGTTFDVGAIARVPAGNGQAITYSPLAGGQLPPGQVAILFLARYGTKLTSCPDGVTPAVTDLDTAVHGTGLGSAFHITASAPVVAYDVFPYGGGRSQVTSSTLLLPTSAWDTNYIGVNAYRKGQIGVQPLFLEIVAADDATDVTISPTAAIAGAPGVAPTAKGTPHTYTLSKGQVLQITQDEELTGSPIQSTKPIGVWSGATCLNIDVTENYCDSAHQEIPPVRALGHEYAAVRYRNRVDFPEETPPWRFVGAVNGTVLSYEPAAPLGAPKTLALGEVREFPSAGQFVVKSQDEQHPFYAAAYMTGGAKFNETGDPEFVNIVPTAQYLSSYVFFADPTYSETNLVFVRTRGPSGFEDVTLDCHGKLAGWSPLGSSGKYEFLRWDLVTGNFQTDGACDNGRREAKSAAPFGITVWGWGSFQTKQFPTIDVSYAYPAGASVQPINQVVVPAVPR
jgi:hypothetical protein